MYGSAAGGHNPVTAALRLKRQRTVPPLQVANGFRSVPGPQVESDAPAAAVRDAWRPVLVGQKVPMFSERVVGDEPCILE